MGAGDFFNDCHSACRNSGVGFVDHTQRQGEAGLGLFFNFSSSQSNPSNVDINAYSGMTMN